MPEIRVPHVFSSGDAIDADQFSQNVSLAGPVPNSFEVVNGWLDGENLPEVGSAADWKVQGLHLKNDTFATGGMVGSTENLDFFWDAFPAVDVETLNRKNIPVGRFKPIPGACASFYVPYEAIVFFTWQVSFSSPAVTHAHSDEMTIAAGLPAHAIEISTDNDSVTAGNALLHRGFVQPGDDHTVPEIRLIINDRRAAQKTDVVVPTPSKFVAREDSGGAPEWTRRYGHRGGVEGPNIRSERHYSRHFSWGVKDNRANAGDESEGLYVHGSLGNDARSVSPGWYSAGLYLGLEGFLEGVQQTTSDDNKTQIAYWRQRGSWCARTRVRNFKYLIIRV